MLISCPKCNAVYNVSDNQIPSDGKRFKCAECGNIWLVKPTDAIIQVEKSQNSAKENTKTKIKPQVVSPKPEIDNQPENKSDDIQDMFSRLSRDTKGLFSENQSNKNIEWIKLKLRMFFTPVVFNCFILILIFAFTFIIGYFNRFEIVGYMPRMDNFYEKFGIECYYEGRDVVFSNVSARNIERNGIPFIEISGLLINNGKYTAKLLPIKATVYDLKGSVESEAEKTLTLHKLEPSFRAVFRIVVPNKTPEAKKISLYFVK